MYAQFNFSKYLIFFTLWLLPFLVGCATIPGLPVVIPAETETSVDGLSITGPEAAGPRCRMARPIR